MENIRWAEALEQTSLAIGIQENLIAFPLLEVLHVCSIALVVGSIFLVDLRLIHLASVSYRVDRLMRVVLPVTIGAFVIALLSGFLMFASQATSYLANTAFLIKMGLLVAAGVNMVIFHMWSHRKVGGWEGGSIPPIAARFAGFSSMVVWTMILTAGRFVGFA